MSTQVSRVVYGTGGPTDDRYICKLKFFLEFVSVSEGLVSTGSGRVNKKVVDLRSRLCYLVTPAMRGRFFDVAASQRP